MRDREQAYTADSRIGSPGPGNAPSADPSHSRGARTAGQNASAPPSAVRAAPPELPPTPAARAEPGPFPLAASVLAVVMRHLPGASLMGQEDGATHPSVVAQYALAAMDTYCAGASAPATDTLVTGARWLVTHQVATAPDACGWPVPGACPEYEAPGPWLAASTQALGLAVLSRAYAVTGDTAFLATAERAMRTFTRDILDGGVCAPIGEDRVVIEEVAVYPAAHHVGGLLLALVGLHDLAAFQPSRELQNIARRAHLGFHAVLAAIDLGFGTRVDLTGGRMATPEVHAGHTELLLALARTSGCGRCQATAERWQGYERQRGARLRAQVARGRAAAAQVGSRTARRLVFGAEVPVPRRDLGAPIRVCVPITAFPIAGGTRGVLLGVEKAMEGTWRMEYLTHAVGPHAEGYVIQRFGGSRASHWQFPNVWLYWLAGQRTLRRLLRRGAGYHLVLPQDSLYTGAFSVLAARLAGIRVVCMDHGTLTYPFSPSYRAERSRPLRSKALPARILSRLRFACYWPSLRAFGRVVAHRADFCLANGAEVATAYARDLSVPVQRLATFPFTVDIDRFAPANPEMRARMREARGIPSDAILITMVNRLAPEKGVDVAVEGLARALPRLDPTAGARVRLVIAGEGPARPTIEAAIARNQIASVCALWGELIPDDVARLLGISDVFIYAGVRGAGTGMAELEAMAAGCALIASSEPPSMVELCADGRGLAVPPGNPDALADALVVALSSPDRRRSMGQLAREYVSTRYNAMALRRCLLRATFFVPQIAEAPMAGLREFYADHAEGSR